MTASASAPAQLASGTISIRDVANPLQVLSGWRLAITGLWPSQCPPTLQTASLEGNDLRIDARSVFDLCPREPTPFSVELNPALVLQRRELDAGVYRVYFYAGSGVQAQPQLLAFALVNRSGADAQRIIPENGFWWSTGPDRTVLSIERQGSQLSAALLSYDPAGQPAWLFGTARFDGRVAHIPLLHLSGGAEPFARATTVPHGDSAMTLDLQFTGAARANAWLSRPGGDNGALQLRALEMVRLPLAASDNGAAWLGEWVLVGGKPDATPLRLRFDRFQSLDKRHFELIEDATANALTCVRDRDASDEPPHACALHFADGTITQFDSVAIERMDGVDANGAAMHLLRVTP